MKIKTIWLINIGEPLPFDGNKAHRMCNWKNLLEKEGFNINFITTNFEHQRKKWLTKNMKGYTILNSVIGYKKNMSIKRLLNHFFISISFIFYLIKNKKPPDLIIVSYPTMLLSLVAVFYGFFKNIKVFVDVRDKWPDIFQINNMVLPFLTFHKIIKYLVFKISSFTLAVSPGYLYWAIKNSKKGTIIPLSKTYIEPINRSLDISKEINFIFSESLGDTYDLDFLFKFSDNLSKKNILHNLYICGDGPKMSRLQAKSIKFPNVVLLGWLNNLDLQKKLDNAHFGLMTYNQNSPQGWPNKLIEYMSNGLPIINTLDGESSDLIENSKLGFNINNMSLNQLSELINNLAKSPQKYKSISENNYSLFLSDFSDKKAHQKLINIINKYV